MDENKVAFLMGSDSDFPTLEDGIKLLIEKGIKVDVYVLSAHRSPKVLQEFASNAEKDGYKVIIAAAGKAAHLAGVVAANTVLPVIGIPIRSSALDGLDSLLSTVQMPKGVPVATVAIDGGYNAAILAMQIIALFNSEVKERLHKLKEDMSKEVAEKNKDIQKKLERFH